MFQARRERGAGAGTGEQAVGALPPQSPRGHSLRHMGDGREEGFQVQVQILGEAVGPQEWGGGHLQQGGAPPDCGDMAHSGTPPKIPPSPVFPKRTEADVTEQQGH